MLVNGTVACWGRPQSIGASGIVSSVLPLPVDRVTKIAAGTTATCAITCNSSVICWGENDYGVLGYSISDPVQVRLAESPWVVLFDGQPLQALSITPGYHSMCATTVGSTAVCWGRNDHDSLSLSSEPYITPHRVDMVSG